MDLDSKIHHLELRQYMDKVAKYRRSPVWSISYTDMGKDRPMPRDVTAADHLGPGTYRVDQDFPTRDGKGNLLPGTHGVGWLTRSARSKSWTQPVSLRPDMITGTSPGPAHYNVGAVGALSQEFRQSKWTVPLACNLTGRPNPRKACAADHLAPGFRGDSSLVPVQSRFSDLSWRKQMKLEKAAKANKEHWAKKEWSHVLGVVNPKPKASCSMPQLGGAGKH